MIIYFLSFPSIFTNRMSVKCPTSPTPSLALSDAVVVNENESTPPSVRVPRDGLNAVISATAHKFTGIIQALAGLGYAIGPNSSECSPSPPTYPFLLGPFSFLDHCRPRLSFPHRQHPHFSCCNESHSFGCAGSCPGLVLGI